MIKTLRQNPALLLVLPVLAWVVVIAFHVKWEVQATLVGACLVTGMALYGYTYQRRMARDSHEFTSQREIESNERTRQREIEANERTRQREIEADLRKREIEVESRLYNEKKLIYADLLTFLMKCFEQGNKTKQQALNSDWKKMVPKLQMWGCSKVLAAWITLMSEKDPNNTDVQNNAITHVLVERLITAMREDVGNTSDGLLPMNLSKIIYGNHEYSLLEESLVIFEELNGKS